MRKKIVFIDWNKTLSYDLFWGHLEKKSHPNHHHLDAIEKWLFIEHRDVINPWMKGQVDVDYIIDNIHKDTNIDKKILLNELRHSCRIMKICLPDIKDLIKELNLLGVKVAIATDNMDTFKKFTIPAMRLEEIFDDILISSDIGILKDDREPADSIGFFDEYLINNNLSYKDAILLDDSPDISGKYKLLNFDRILVNNPESLRKALKEIADAQK